MSDEVSEEFKGYIDEKTRKMKLENDAREQALLDRFAMAALTGLLTSATKCCDEDLAFHAYAQARAMFRERGIERNKEVEDE